MIAANSEAANFGTKDGSEPANIAEITTVLRQDSYDMELLISYGTSQGGSAGHLALAIHDSASGEDVVYSANFYADRARKHDNGFYTDDLMIKVPKAEYLFKTRSSLGNTASFGLDFGEIYKRSVIGYACTEFRPRRRSPSPPTSGESTTTITTGSRTPSTTRAKFATTTCT
jgi:hypothetical protein